MIRRAWTFLSILPIVVGSSVILGWLLDYSALIQVNSTYLPIVFNGAICFLLTGIALLLFNFSLEKIQRIQMLLGVIIVIISGLTLSQYLPGIEFNIDRLIQTSSLREFYETHSGRMPPNSALSFVLIGLIFILMPIAQKKVFGFFIEVFIFLLFMISVLSLCGYILGIEFLYGWLVIAKMQFISALCFFGISIALGGIWRSNPASMKLYKGHEDVRIILLSGAILLCMAIIITLVSFAFLKGAHDVGNIYAVTPIILLIIVVGLVLLRLQVIPLVQRVLQAERGLLISNKRLEESENRYAIAMRGSGAGLWDWNLEQETVFYSPYFKGMLGYGDTEFPNTLDAFKKILHPDDFQRVADHVQQHIDNQVPYDIEYRLKRKTGEYRWYHAKGQAIWNDQGHAIRMAGSLLDVTERKKLEKRLAAQYAVTRILSETSDIEDDAEQIVQALCEQLEWDVGSLWMVEEKSNLICCKGIWYNTVSSVKNFAEVTRRMRLAMGMGLPGRVWKTGQQLWIYDVLTDKNFTRAEEARIGDLHTVFCFPIRVQKKVLGVLEFMSRQRQSPDESILKIMSVITAQIGHFIDRKQTENQLNENERYRAATLEPAIVRDVTHQKMEEMKDEVTIAKQGLVASKTINKKDLTKDKKKLLICGSPTILTNLNLILSPSEYQLDNLDNTNVAKKTLEEQQYDGMLLDITLPHAISFIRKLSSQDTIGLLPIYIISLREESDNLLINGNGLPIGGWLNKPVDFNELIRVIENFKEETPRILHVRTNPDSSEIIRTLLHEQANIVDADGLEKTRKYLEREHYDLAILDLLIFNDEIADILQLIIKYQCPLIIISSAESDEDNAQLFSQTLLKSTTSVNDFKEHVKNCLGLS